ncbi:MAG TPA: hypothetical protein VHN15_04015 [Thermoanaerobaculia bacterium]|nr:hypothetical protein [Thermoanaerobaculia bacterium]
MILLTKGEELLLVQFAEAKGERIGAQVGDSLPAEAFDDLVGKTPGVEFEGALDTLVDRNLLSREEGRYILTREGYDYLYTREGRRITES